MRFTPTVIPGAWLIEPEPIADERGWFARVFDADEFRARGIGAEVIQCSTSYNVRRDTLRGLHYQSAPYGEPKLVRCVRGAVFDVGVDLRPNSGAYCKWYGLELTAENRWALYLPPGVAHGFQTLQDETELLYQMGERHVPEASTGVRWNDPRFGIEWPEPRGDRIISLRDSSYPDFLA